MERDAPVIVVGVDSSLGSSAALRWAAREAAVHGAELHAVHVRRGGGAAALLGEEQSLDELELSVESVLGPEPVVPVVRHLVDGPAGAALCLAAAEAQLLVLGSHRRGLVGEALLGSVSHYCTRHAPCPVVIVPITVADDVERIFPVNEMAGAGDS
jgi:nucleotide-binding universal stress UspA family protein